MEQRGEIRCLKTGVPFLRARCALYSVRKEMRAKEVTEGEAVGKNRGCRDPKDKYHEREILQDVISDKHK